MKYQTTFLLLLTFFIASCLQQRESSEELKTPIKEADKKYQVKSGTITYETTLNTLSVHMSYKTIVFFDDYGLKERRDTYEGDRLSDTFMSDGESNYKIIYQNKEVYRTGKAYRGTEPKFGWDDISEEDKLSGKVTKLEDTTIANKRCHAYSVQTNVVTSTFAGWKNILMLSSIQSAGGSSITRAVKIKAGKIPRNTFDIPQGFKMR